MLDLHPLEANLFHRTAVKLFKGAFNRDLNILWRLGNRLSLTSVAVAEHPSNDIRPED